MKALVCAKELLRSGPNCEPSLVMNDINSLTHSCMHSFASFAILAFSGRAVFMIRATGAKLRMLASETGPCELSVVVEEGESDGGELSDMLDTGPARNIQPRSLCCDADHG